MLSIKPLSSSETETLTAMHKNHSAPAARTRAQAILLNNKGFNINKITKVINACRQTVATWIHNWEDKGIRSLIDLPRSGRPRIRHYTDF